MNKKRLIILLWLLVFILWVVFWLVKLFKCITCTKATKLINRYWEIQEEYKVYEWKMDALHNEADEIREIALNEYWIVFTEAWREIIK